MRKYSVMILIALMVVALGSVACSSTDKALDENLTPEEMLAAALDETASLESASGSYEVEVTLDMGGQSLMDELAMFQMFLGGPITASGTFAGQDDPVRADLTVNVGVSAFEIPAGIRVVDEEAWLLVMDQWYEAPEELLQEIDLSDEETTAEMPEEMTALIEDMDISVASWTTGLTREADETIADTETVHLSGALDVEQIVDDAFELAQQPEVAELMGEAEDLAATEMPSAFEFATAKAIIETMIQDNTVDVWIAKADSSVRKIVMTVDMVFPPEADMEGIDGITVVVTIELDEPGAKVEVKAPESAKPFEELETDLESSPIFGGLGDLLGF